MNLDKYIGELLFLHDCVIIPDFGGFVTNYAPAKIHPVQHTLSPPSKKIAFNKKLQNNDGLLASFISKEETISYAEANKSIQSQVEIFNTILKDGKKVILKNIGVLYFDVEKNLQFEADTNINYLPDAFGLVAVQSPAIKRENIQKRIEKQFQDRPAIQAPAPVKRFPWKVLIPAPFIALAIWGSIYTGAFSTLNINYNSLNPFASSASETTPVVNMQPKANETKLISANPETQEPVAEAGGITEVTTPEVITAPASVDVPQEQIAPATTTNTIIDFSYFIVAGCFREPANADNMLRFLQAKGFNAFIKGKTPGGLIVVCYAGFATRQEAVGELARIQTENDKSAWLSAN